jgi:hypothetical protein
LSRFQQAEGLDHPLSLPVRSRDRLIFIRCFDFGHNGQGITALA